MKRSLLLALIVGLSCTPRETVRPEVAAWKDRAARITIVRDEWGIAHVYGKTDADAVFGMIYAQAEDDFHRIEVNYLNAMGRLAESEGESEIFRDLRMKLFIEPAAIRAHYAACPEWLRALMIAWADGLNYFLYQNPHVSSEVIKHFEPWMALTFTEGSIGGDIERVDMRGLEAFYGASAHEQAAAHRGDGKERQRVIARRGLAYPADDPFAEPSGSNGFAIAPANSAAGNALLLINPHTSFYFRSELHMASEEGLNAYGAVTWGQFFVYQGFNKTAGWMHTSTGADAIDEYIYDVASRDDGIYYAYGDEERRMEKRVVIVPYRTADGMAERTFTVYASHHGPIVRSDDGRWVSVKLMNEPIAALTQSYSRTKAADYDAFRETMEWHTNSSNNTVFADAKGNIAYFHANFVPKRDPRFDWQRPVDGSDPSTEWQGLHSVDETVGSLNPRSGWIQNTNNWPFSVAGVHSPKQHDFPPYMETYGENARGLHAIRVLEGKTDFALESLIEAAYDSYLSGFERLIPALVAAYEGTPESNPLRTHLAAPVAMLRAWDLRSGVDSIPTSLAVYWGDELIRLVRDDAQKTAVSVYDYMANDTPTALHLQALAHAVDKLEADFGDWRTAWGEINRFQRLTGEIVQPFDDAAPSTPVGFVSGRWGSLASFGTARYPVTKRRYGTGGNSFVAVVEFGDRLEARAITAGGSSGDPASPHFDDQIDRYIAGDLRPVYFYRDDVEAHAERTYHPGS